MSFRFRFEGMRTSLDGNTRCDEEHGNELLARCPEVTPGATGGRNREGSQPV